MSYAMVLVMSLFEMMQKFILKSWWQTLVACVIALLLDFVYFVISKQTTMNFLTHFVKLQSVRKEMLAQNCKFCSPFPQVGI